MNSSGHSEELWLLILRIKMIVSIQTHTGSCRLSLENEVCWQGFGSRDIYRDGFFEKLLEAPPMTDRTDAR